jgi:hypothetical protein
VTERGRLTDGTEEDFLGSLLASLPVATPVEVESTLRGLLLPSPGDGVRLVIANQVFEFGQQDIVSARSYDGAEAPVGTVELTLRRGATVRGVYPARPFRELLRGRRPFAFSTRGGTAALSTCSARYDELERDYLTRRGLLPAP